jgi:hypothetical protein
VANADQQLDAMIRTLRHVGGRELLREIAAEAAPDVEKALRTTAAAGTTPTGDAWKPTQAGTRPLQHAPEHLRAEAVGTSVRATLTGPDALHNYGAGRGRVRRQVLPDGGEPPPPVADAVRAAAERVFERVTGEVP